MRSRPSIKYDRDVIAPIIMELEKYVCPICGYIYDPEEGDPDHGVPAGTPFEDVPDDWVCPYCGATKSSMQSFSSVMGG